MFRKTGILPIAAAVVISAAFAVSSAMAQPQDPKSLGFKKQFVIEIRNPGALTLENHPIVLNVDEIRAFDPGFNSYNFAIFDETGGDYRLVVSQADDLNRDRIHEEIVFLRTLPPSSTTKLTCYYSPKGSLQLMMSAPKASARLVGAQGTGGLGWESNLAAFKVVNGRIEVYGKLYAGLVLAKLPADDAILQEWGLNILGSGGTPGLGGLSLWAGKTRIPLSGGAASKSGYQVQRTVLASGPLRALVKAEYSGIRPGQGDYGAVVLYSAWADNIFSRQDVLITGKAGAPTMFSVDVQKLPDEAATFDKDKGFLASWGRGSALAGEIGLAALFVPTDFAGLDEGSTDRSIKLRLKPGAKQTFWTAGGWVRGIVTASAPAEKNWALMMGELGLKLRVPIEIRYKAK
jgi:hypothetical protein